MPLYILLSRVAVEVDLMPLAVAVPGVIALTQGLLAVGHLPRQP
jgi:hypothetical protein